MKRKDTSKAKVLNYLKTGHTLSNSKAMAMFGYFRLPVAIQGLRRDGHIIRTESFKGPEGTTMSYYRYVGELKPGTSVAVTGGYRRGAVGTVVRLTKEDGDALIKIKGVGECYVSLTYLDILQ